MNSQNNLSFLVTLEQTINFIRNRFVAIAISSVVISLASSLLTYLVFDPATITANMIYYRNAYDIVGTIFGVLLLLFIVYLFISSVMIGIIYNLSASEKFDLKLVLQRLLPAFLNLLGFACIYTIITIVIAIVVSLIFGIIGFILPSRAANILILLSCATIGLFISVIAYYFCASLIRPNSKGFFQKFADCHKLTATQWKAPLLMVLISWVINVILFFISAMLGDNIVVMIIYSVLSTFLSFFVYSFFFRLYSASNVVEQPNLDNNNQNNQQVIS